MGTLRRVAYQVAQARGLRPADADDVAQRTVLQLLDVGSDVRSPLAWVRLVAARNAIDVIRRRARFTALETDEEVSGPGATSLDPWSERAPPPVDVRMDVGRALHRLAPRVRDAFIAYSVEQYSFEELTAQTGLSRSTLFRRIKRGQRSLRAALAPRVLDL